MSNRRVAPLAGAPNPFTIPGTSRAYTCALGSTLDVNDADALILANAGWLLMLPKDGFVGPTTSRPAHAHIGHVFIDTTLNAIVTADGQGNWLNTISGASA